MASTFSYTISLILVTMLSFIIGNILSNKIDDPTMKVLFWFMYLITIMTIAVIGMVIFFYFILKDKRGPPGMRGVVGEGGEGGDVGKCQQGCRNQICYKKTIKSINTIVNKLAGNPDKEILVKNVYIMNKANQICASEEFAQLVPYRGPNDLIKYLQEIWTEWVELIYKAGGRAYFESIGAENDFEWIGENPFDEIKKYDVFYWGMGEAYRPEIIQKCEKKSASRNLQEGEHKGHPSLNKDTHSNKPVNKGKGWVKSGKKDDKYSVIRYLNLVAEAELLERDTQKRYYAKTIDTNQPNAYSIQEYDPDTEKFGLCARVSNEEGTQYVECDPSDKKQVWELELSGNKKGETRVKSSLSNEYLGGVFDMN